MKRHNSAMQILANKAAALLGSIMPDLEKAYQSVTADAAKFPPTTVQVVNEAFSPCRQCHDAATACLKNSYSVTMKGGRLDDLQFDAKSLQEVAKKARDALKQYKPIAKAIGA